MGETGESPGTDMAAADKQALWTMIVGMIDSIYKIVLGEAYIMTCIARQPTAG